MLKGFDLGFFERGFSMYAHSVDDQINAVSFGQTLVHGGRYRIHGMGFWTSKCDFRLEKLYRVSEGKIRAIFSAGDGGPAIGLLLPPAEGVRFEEVL